MFATVSQVSSGKYYVSFNVETENIIAFDLGLKEFMIDTNGSNIERPRALYKYENRLKKLQRQL